MKQKFVFVALVFLFVGFSDVVPWSKVQNDLEMALSRMIPQDSFLVQVHVQTDTVSERKLSEGESIVQNSGSQEIVVPPLPGFTPPAPIAKATPPAQTRQVFKMVDREVLKSVDVLVTLDESLNKDVILSVQKYVQNFLGSHFGNKARVNFQLMKMVRSQGLGLNAFDSKLWWILGFLILLGAVLFMLRYKNPRRVYPTVQAYPHEGEAQSGDIVYSAKKGQAQDSFRNTEQQTKPLALPSGNTNNEKMKFPMLPATENFIDRRYELLSVFLKHADVFRMYFEKLSEAAQLELYCGLRGPAFDSFLDTLKLSIPKGSENVAQPSEEQMSFYLKNFTEFMQTNHWQKEQFFGFLQHMTLDTLVALVRQENPLIVALILKSLKPEQSAHVLKELSSEERRAILGQSQRLSEITGEELQSIEASVRARAEKLPKLLMSYSQEELDYWTKVLVNSENQDQILIDLEAARPELYPQLAKFRFKLEDVPTLPSPLIQKVINEVDNDELAMALITCPKDIADFVLNEIQTNRRALLATQILMLQNVPQDSLVKARQTLTHRFREVMT